MLIFKEQLPACVGRQTVKLPFANLKQAKENIMHLGVQYGRPCIWFNVVEKEWKEFIIFAIGTGHDFKEHLTKEQFIGTIVLEECDEVLHYFLISENQYNKMWQRSV